LTPEQKEENKGISQERTMVEHSIGGMKRYRILSLVKQCKGNVNPARPDIICSNWFSFYTPF
jgi:DDE superfamily endonuclease